MNCQPSDSDLIQEVLGGNPRRYAVLVDRYQHMVYTLAVRMLRNRPLAEETAQDVFLKAFKSLDGFREEAKFSTWLYRIAYHRILDVCERERRRLQNTTSLPEGWRDPTGMNTTWDRMLREERGQLVRQAMNALEAQDRTVLSLFYLQELPVREMAGILGISEGAVKVRLHRARERFRGYLKGTKAGTLIQEYGCE